MIFAQFKAALFHVNDPELASIKLQSFYFSALPHSGSKTPFNWQHNIDHIQRHGVIHSVSDDRFPCSE